MLEIKFFSSPVTISSVEFSDVITSVIQKTGWPGGIDESRKALASVLDFRPKPLNTGVVGRGPDRGSVGIEFFSKDDNFLCVINSLETALRSSVMVHSRGALQRYNVGPWFGVDENDSFLVGVIGPDPAKADTLLSTLKEAIDEALEVTLEGKRAKRPKHVWTNFMPGSRKLSFNEWLRDRGTDVRFLAADLTKAVIERAEVMADKNVRTLMVEISEARFAREIDILSRRGGEADEYGQALESIKTASLVDSEYVLQCKKTSAQLGRIADKEFLRNSGFAEIKCTSCGRKFSEELLKEGYSISTAGAEMLRGSHWMTVWVSDKLTKLGVPVESIFWNLEDAGEEVDIVVEFGGGIWIFELKDREFGAGDAHPFNYRAVRYKADHAVIITTDKVAPDARRVFTELASTRPIFIEGLENVFDDMRKAFDGEALGKAKAAINAISLVSGHDLTAFLDNLTTPSGDFD